ncbi:MAG: gliding motility protein RemB, partial [Flavobacteriaceae bacterium]
NHELGQGNTANFRHLEFDAGYVINPSSQLKLFTRIILRSFSPEVSEGPNQKLNTTWWSLGLSTDLFNWYRDF